MKNYNLRPIFIYFGTIFGTTAFAMSGSFGWWALLWALLATLVFGVSIPSPFFVYKWALKKEIAKPVSILVSCYAASFVFLSLIFAPQTGSLAGGLFMGFLYYGYPGTIMSLLAFRFLRKKAAPAVDVPS